MQKDICSGIGALRRIKPFVPLRSLKMLYKALIQPYFDYCSPLWDTCGKVHKDKLQVLQNRAARVITGARFDVKSANVLEDLQWSTLDVRRHRLKRVLMYKIVNEQSAPSLREEFIKLKILIENIIFEVMILIQHFQNLKQTILNVLLSIVVQCCGIVFLLRRKRHPRFTNINAA